MYSMVVLLFIMCKGCTLCVGQQLDIDTQHSLQPSLTTSNLPLHPPRQLFIDQLQPFFTSSTNFGQLARSNLPLHPPHQLFIDVVPTCLYILLHHLFINQLQTFLYILFHQLLINQLQPSFIREGWNQSINSYIPTYQLQLQPSFTSSCSNS